MHQWQFTLVSVMGVNPCRWSSQFQLQEVKFTSSLVLHFLIITIIFKFFIIRLSSLVFIMVKSLQWSYTIFPASAYVSQENFANLGTSPVCIHIYPLCRTTPCARGPNVIPSTPTVEPTRSPFHPLHGGGGLRHSFATGTMRKKKKKVKRAGWEQKSCQNYELEMPLYANNEQ